MSTRWRSNFFRQDARANYSHRSSLFRNSPISSRYISYSNCIMCLVKHCSKRINAAAWRGTLHDLQNTGGDPFRSSGKEERRRATSSSSRRMRERCVLFSSLIEAFKDRKQGERVIPRRKAYSQMALIAQLCPFAMEVANFPDIVWSLCIYLTEYLLRYN